ncbi:MAG: 2-phosphosulfolactate phosphatase [Bacteroidia bacterium]|nr:2-phosphosulfolactate phosphatase [Bacteroidia bacterium]
MTLDICPSPALYSFYRKDNDTVVVVDIFRATTTMCAAFNNGATAIIPVSDIKLAKKYKSEGFLVGAERNARKMDFADFGNSPFEYTREKVLGREIAFTTTNGTQAIEAAKGCEQLFIGAFSNIDVLADKCLSARERIVVLCAGWNNKVNIEDTLFGGAFAEKLLQKTEVIFESDTVQMAMHLWRLAKENPIEFVKLSDHYKRLVDNGVKSDAPFCFMQNTVSVVPVYDKIAGKLTAE